MLTVFRTPLVVVVSIFAVTAACRGPHLAEAHTLSSCHAADALSAQTLGYLRYVANDPSTSAAAVRAMWHLPGNVPDTAIVQLQDATVCDQAVQAYNTMRDSTKTALSAAYVYRVGDRYVVESALPNAGEFRVTMVFDLAFQLLATIAS